MSTQAHTPGPLLVKYVTMSNMTEGLALVRDEDELTDRFGDFEVFHSATVIAEGDALTDFLKRVQISAISQATGGTP